MDGQLTAKSTKFTSLENLHVYGSLCSVKIRIVITRFRAIVMLDMSFTQVAIKVKSEIIYLLQHEGVNTIKMCYTKHYWP